MKGNILNHFPDDILKKHLLEKKLLEKHGQMILNKIFKMCLTKKLQFEVRPTLDLVNVLNEDFSFNYSAYFKGDLMNFQGSHSQTIDRLLELVKAYKP